MKTAEGVTEGVTVFVGVGVWVVGVWLKLTVGVTVGVSVGVGVDEGQGPKLTMFKGAPYNSTVIDSAHRVSENRGAIGVMFILPVQPVHL